MIYVNNYTLFTFGNPSSESFTTCEKIKLKQTQGAHSTKVHFVGCVILTTNIIINNI